MTIEYALRERANRWRREADLLDYDVTHGALTSRIEEAAALAVSKRLKRAASELERLADMAD